jgi:TonB family protein
MKAAFLGLALASASIEGQLPHVDEVANRPVSLMEGTDQILGTTQDPCAILPPSAQARVIGFSAYEGSEVSTVYVGDEDEVTSLIKVRIEEGDAPLYLLLTSYDPVIWQFDGAIERVEHVVASAYSGPAGADGRQIRDYSHVGVTGVDSDRVSITSNNCLPELRYFQRNSSVRERIIAVTRREPDAIASGIFPISVSLPSGNVTNPPFPDEAVIQVPPGYDEREWREAISTTVSGLTLIEPEEVVSPAIVDRYQVMPQGFGLAQLVGAGKLQRLGHGRYLVVENIARIPAGLAGGHSAILILADGVAMPPGDPAHGCVLRLEPGMDTSGLACPPPPPAVAPAPRVIPPPSLQRVVVPQVHQEAPRSAVLQTDLAVITERAYPRRALREGVEGNVRYGLVVGADGRVVACSIIESSLSALLDEATCEGLARYARFQPATNNRGEPTTDRLTGTMEWRLPPQTAAPFQALPSGP